MPVWKTECLKHFSAVYGLVHDRVFGYVVLLNGRYFDKKLQLKDNTSLFSAAVKKGNLEAQTLTRERGSSKKNLPVLIPELAMTVASLHWSALDTEYERWCIPSGRLLKDTRLMPLAIWDTEELLVTDPVK